MILPLLLGTGMLLGSLPSYGVATALLARLLAPLLRGGHARVTFWRYVVAMTALALITVAMHLTQIALWAVILREWAGCSTFDQAFYLSAQNYTALGYGDVLLPGPWRLLGPLEAINGLLLFGLSTAVLFAVMSQLIANHYRHEFGR